MTDLRKMLMTPEAIKERTQLADASQKELCAEISLAEDADFGLGLFDVLQEMYNAGYARGAAPEGNINCGECGAFLFSAKYIEQLNGVTLECQKCGELKLIQVPALSPARSGEPPQCPECHVPLRDETAHYRCDKCHARYSSSLEHGLYRLPDDRIVIPAAPQPVSGDAPKVEEIARQLSQKFGFHSSRVLTYEGALGFLRPYFPPASQTPNACHSVETFVDNFLRGNLWLSAEHEAEKRDAIAVLLKNYAKHLLATPASTARTDDQYEKLFTAIQEAITCSKGVKDGACHVCIGRLADEYEKMFPDGVPQAEPPKEEK